MLRMVPRPGVIKGSPHRTPARRRAAADATVSDDIPH